MDGRAPGRANLTEQANIERVALLEKRAAHNRTFADRVSALVTRITGSVPFVLAHVVWFTLWIVANQGLIAGVEPFDPYPFNFLTLTVSLEAIFLTSFVLMMQSRQSRDAKAKVKVDIEHRRIRELLEDTDMQAVAADLERHLDEA